MRTMQSSQRFIGVCAALFIGSAALTIGWYGSMSSMMPMCGTRGMPSTMRGAAAFGVMWLTMMVAMMLPSLMPMLLRYRQTVGATTTARLDALTGVVAIGYFLVWAVLGAFAFFADATLSTFEMHWPPATGSFVLIAGALQFSRWKAHHLACCRDAPACCGARLAEGTSALRYGVHLGIHCVHCCFGLTVVLLALGMMDLRAMALVTAAIWLERLAPDGLRVARFVGGILIASGTLLIAHAMS